MARQTTTALNVLRSPRPIRPVKRASGPKRPRPSSEKGIYANPTMLRPGGLR